MSNMYILTDDRRVKPITSAAEWDKWFGNTENRVVACEEIGGAKISTVFLGLDHSFSGPPPVLWETMIFWPGNKMDQDQDRCSGSWEQAEAMHQRMYERVWKKMRYIRP